MGSPASELESRYPRNVLVGVSMILMGVVIGALSYPVSQASHAIAEQVQARNPKAEQVRAITQNAIKTGEKATSFSNVHDPDESPIMKLIRVIVAMLGLMWCCCVCIMGGLAEWIIEPIGRMLGVAAQFSVYTMSVFFLLFGLAHIASGIGLARGRSYWSPRFLLLLDGFQGLFFLGASVTVWDFDEPLEGIVALMLGVVLAGWCFFACWWIGRRN